MKTETNNSRTIAIIGAGAAGLMAAAAAGHAGCRILLFDRNDHAGRKIYATGNGRCNLTNRAMCDDFFNTPIGFRIDSFNSRSLERYFEDRGVFLYARDGYVYPRTNQAATIVDALIRDVQTCHIEWHLLERVTEIAQSDRTGISSFQITTKQGTYEADRVILATGGKVSPAFGCTGDGYRIAEGFGHSVTTLTPGLVPVMVEDPMIGIMSGVRCFAIVTAYVDGVDYADAGELQITDSGFSGIPTFQVSRWLSQGLAGRRHVEIGIDFLPELSNDEIEEEVRRRQQDPAVIYVRDVFAGLVHSKIGSYIARCNGLADEKKLSKLENRNSVIASLIRQLNDRRYTVTATAGFDKAQVTAGGIPMEETDETFQSLMKPGVYLAGELLDVDGVCGGYNLTFAMCSGYLAGLHAATD